MNPFCPTCFLFIFHCSNRTKTVSHWWCVQSWTSGAFSVHPVNWRSWCFLSFYIREVVSQQLFRTDNQLHLRQRMVVWGTHEIYHMGCRMGSLRVLESHSEIHVIVIFMTVPRCLLLSPPSFSCGTWRSFPEVNWHVILHQIESRSRYDNPAVFGEVRCLGSQSM